MTRRVLIIDDNVSDSNEIKRHLSGLRAEIYLRHYNTEFGKSVKRFDNSAQKAKRFHLWPGNICELKHVVRVAVLKSRDDIISKENFEFYTPASSLHMNFRLDDTSFEKAKITAAIAHTGGYSTSRQVAWYLRKSSMGKEKKVWAEMTRRITL